MTKSQTSLYWRTWAKVRAYLIDFGGFSKEDADAERHEIHKEALGANKSSKLFNNRDLDIILDHFQSYLVLEEGPTTGPGREKLQPCQRLIYAIDQLGLPEPYLESIARDQFNTSEWLKLSEIELTKFRYTAAARANARRKAQNKTA